MKKLIILVIFLIPAISIAKSNKQAEGNDHDNNCRMYMDLANSIMMQKQNGVPLSKALEGNDYAYKKNKDENMNKIVGLIIRDAYAQPSYSTESIKKEQLNEFSVKYYLGCMAMYE